MCFAARFETRDKEFISVARLIYVALAKARDPQHARGPGVKAPKVTGIIPEARRSSPWQGEVQRKLDGGPLPLLRFKSLR